jgi:hypothetical protein
MLLQSVNESSKLFIRGRMRSNPDDHRRVFQQCISKQTQSLVEVCPWFNRDAVFFAEVSPIPIADTLLATESSPSNAQVLEVHGILYGLVLPLQTIDTELVEEASIVATTRRGGEHGGGASVSFAVINSGVVIWNSQAMSLSPFSEPVPALN